MQPKTCKLGILRIQIILFAFITITALLIIAIMLK